MDKLEKTGKVDSDECLVCESQTETFQHLFLGCSELSEFLECVSFLQMLIRVILPIGLLESFWVIPSKLKIQMRFFFQLLFRSSSLVFQETKSSEK